MTPSPAARRLMSWAPIHASQPCPANVGSDSDRLLDFIAAAGPAGVTRSEIRERLFQKHKRSAEVSALLAPLVHAGRITESTRKTAGRPATVYTTDHGKDATA